MSTPAVDWNKEGLLYRRPHPRLVLMASIVTQLNPRVVLDVGCAAGTLRQLLPASIDYYGCDVSELAASELGADRFRQIDLDHSADLSAFAGYGIDLVHMGGLLEYLQQPQTVLRSARSLVGGGGRLVASIINFASRTFGDPANHHAAWVYKPALDEFRRLLAETGWSVERTVPFHSASWLVRRFTMLRPDDADAPATRRLAKQFVVVARAL
jgi:SAM-dependent methyltransferase